MTTRLFEVGAGPLLQRTDNKIALNKTAGNLQKYFGQAEVKQATAAGHF